MTCPEEISGPSFSLEVKDSSSLKAAGHLTAGHRRDQPEGKASRKRRPELKNSQRNGTALPMTY